MKRILILLVSILFVSCEQMYVYKVQTYENCPDGFDVRTPVISFTSMQEMRFYMAYNLSYCSDRNQFGQDDYWQAPQTFIDNGRGDCEDYAILAMYFLEQMGYKTELILLLTSDKKWHSIITINGQYFEPQGLYEISGNGLDIHSRMSLERALSICYNQFGSRSIK